MSLADWYITAERGKSEITIERSVFIGYTFKVMTKDDVTAALDKLSAEHLKARHIAYAYALISGEIKASDDGEPQGTAGKPLEESLTRAGCRDTLVAVVRYFGGVKLGPGGLKRAYRDAAVAAVDCSEKTRYELCEAVSITTSFKDGETLRKKAAQSQFRIVHTDYGVGESGCTFKIVAPIGFGLKEKLLALLNNRGTATALEPEYVKAQTK